MRTTSTPPNTTLCQTLLVALALLGAAWGASAQTTLVYNDFEGSSETFTTNFCSPTAEGASAFTWSAANTVTNSDGLLAASTSSANYTNQSFDFSTPGKQYIMSIWGKYTGPGGSGKPWGQLGIVSQGATNGLHTSGLGSALSMALWYNSGNSFQMAVANRYNGLAGTLTQNISPANQPINQSWHANRLTVELANLDGNRIMVRGQLDQYSWAGAGNPLVYGETRHRVVDAYVVTNLDLATSSKVWFGFRSRTGAMAKGFDMFKVEEAPVPQPPANLATSLGDGFVGLSWTFSKYALGHNVYRASSAAGPYQQVASLGITNGPSTWAINANFTACKDTGLILGHSYYYYITATNLAGESLASATNSLLYSPPVQNVAAVGGTNQISLSWNPVILLGGATNYTIYRSGVSGGPYTAVGSTTATTYVDTGLDGGQRYYYYVQGTMDGEIPSGASSEVNALTAAAIPANPLAEAFTANVLRFGWTSPDSIPSTTFVEVSTDGINFSPLGVGTNCTPTTGPHSFGGASHWYLAGLAPSTTRYFRAYATNATGFSALSAVVAATTLPIAGISINFSDTAFPTYGDWPIPGYMDDYGLAYGLRTNGWSYGWDRDKTADARVRGYYGKDDRYRTFNQMYTTNDWKMTLPNGLYQVHLSQGDPAPGAGKDYPGARFNVQGVDTEQANPDAKGAFGNWWVDLGATFRVTDGTLTISNGAGLSNNRFQYLDIYPATPTPNTIITQPQSQTVIAKAKAEFSVMVSGGPTPFGYQWYSNSVAIPGATNRTYTIPVVTADDAAGYYVAVTNAGASVNSSTAVLTVTPRTAPVLVSAGSIDGWRVGVAFDEAMDSGSIANPAAYTVNDGAVVVLSATARPDGKTVDLELNNQLTGAFTVAVTNVLDLDSNPLAGAVVTSSVLGFSTVVMGNSSAGSTYTCDSQSVELTGGGKDIWNKVDNCRYIYRTITGDFDARVRVTGLVPGPGYTALHPIAKAVLMARESAADGSAAVMIDVNPPAAQALPSPGRDRYSSDIRAATDADAAGFGWYYQPANIPDCWIRLVRLGNEFRPYRSIDGGATWTLTGLITNAFPSEMLLGLGVTSHEEGGIPQATGTFEGFTVGPPAPDVALSMAASVGTVVTGGPLQYTVTVNNQGSSNAASVTVSDVLPAGVTYVSSWATTGSASESAGTVTWNAGALAAGQSATLTINVTATTLGTQVNTATATATDDSNLLNNSSSTSVAVVSPPDVAVTKTASAGTVWQGDPFQYTLSVTNQGLGDALNVTVNDPLPAGVSYVGSAASAGVVINNGGTLSWNAGAMSAGQAATLTLDVTAAGVGTKVNTAVATATDESNLLDNSSSASVDLIARPDVAVTKTASTATAVIGGAFHYTITLNNPGGNASSVSLTDPLPAGVTYVSSSATLGTPTYDAGTVSWNVGAMLAAQSATLTINVTAATPGSTVNTATAMVAADETNLANNSSAATVNIVQPGQPLLIDPSYNADTHTFKFSFATETGVPYTVQYGTNLTAPIAWQTLQTITGDGTVKQAQDSGASEDPRFYRVIVIP